MTPKQLKGTILWLMMRSSDEELVDMLKYITLEDGSHPVSVLEPRHCLRAEAREIMEHVPDRNKFGL